MEKFVMGGFAKSGRAENGSREKARWLVVTRTLFLWGWLEAYEDQWRFPSSGGDVEWVLGAALLVSSVQHFRSW